VEKRLRTVAGSTNSETHKKACTEIYEILFSAYPESFEGIPRDDFLEIHRVKDTPNKGEISLNLQWNPKWIEQIREKYPETFF